MELEAAFAQYYGQFLPPSELQKEWAHLDKHNFSTHKIGLANFLKQGQHGSRGLATKDTLLWPYKKVFYVLKVPTSMNEVQTSMWKKWVKAVAVGMSKWTGFDFVVYNEDWLKKNHHFDELYIKKITISAETMSDTTVGAYTNAVGCANQDLNLNFANATLSTLASNSSKKEVLKASLERLACHELGHSLGLRHEFKRSDATLPTGAKKVRLHADVDESNYAELDVSDSSVLSGSTYDSNSVMQYEPSRVWEGATKDEDFVTRCKHPSSEDIRFITALYAAADKPDKSFPVRKRNDLLEGNPFKTATTYQPVWKAKAGSSNRL